MPLVLDREVLPLHAQVAAIDSQWRDYPVAADPVPDPYVAADRCAVAVGAIQDLDGNARVMVAMGMPEESETAGFVQRWTGSLGVPSGVLQVGNVEADDLHEVQVSPGDHRLTVLVRPDTREPREVLFVLDS